MNTDQERTKDMMTPAEAAERAKFNHLYLDDVLAAADGAVARLDDDNMKFDSQCEKLFEIHWQVRNTLSRLGLMESPHTTGLDEVVYRYLTNWKDVEKDFEVIVQVTMPEPGKVTALCVEWPMADVPDETEEAEIYLLGPEHASWDNDNQLALSDGKDKLVQGLKSFVELNDREFAELRKDYLRSHPTEECEDKRDEQTP